MRGKSVKVIAKYAAFKNPGNSDKNVKRKLKREYLAIPRPHRAEFKGLIKKEMGKE